MHLSVKRLRWNRGERSASRITSHLSGLNSFLAIAVNSAIIGPTQSTCEPGSQCVLEAACKLKTQHATVVREASTRRRVGREWESRGRGEMREYQMKKKRAESLAPFACRPRAGMQRAIWGFSRADCSWQESATNEVLTHCSRKILMGGMAASDMIATDV